MKTLFKNFLLSVSPPEEAQLSEAECLIAKIEEAKDKILYAQNHFDHAAPEYVELSLNELHFAETHYNLLLKRYRLMQDSSKPGFPLEKDLQSQALYKTISAPSTSHSQ